MQVQYNIAMPSWAVHIITTVGAKKCLLGVGEEVLIHALRASLRNPESCDPKQEGRITSASRLLTCGT